MGYNTHDPRRQVAVHTNARPNAAKAASFNPIDSEIQSDALAQSKAVLENVVSMEFDEMDADGDGRVTKDELVAWQNRVAEGCIWFTT